MKLPEEDRLNLSINYMHEVKRAEDAAGDLIRLAVREGWVEFPWPPFAERYGEESEERDRWYDTVFGVTERELIEGINAAVYRANRLKRKWWRNRTGYDDAVSMYIRLRAMLMSSYGLETVWWP